jgi:hypothetical protein
MSKVFKRVRQVPSGTILPLHEVRRRAVVDAIDKCSGNYRLAAKMLGVGRTTIYRWVYIHGYGLPKDRSALLPAPPHRRSESEPPVHDQRDQLREVKDLCGPGLQRVG